MANRPLTKKEKKAWIFAKEAHKDQVRKFINLPYFDAHVQKVNGIVKQYTNDIDLLCAALLHDTIEDCFDSIEIGYLKISEEFGKRIADIVLELTSSKDDIINNYSGSKANYLINKMTYMSDDALIIKLADRLQNISDAFTASPKFRNSYFKETNLIIDALESKRRMNSIQRRILEQIKYKLENIGSIFKIKRYKDI